MVVAQNAKWHEGRTLERLVGDSGVIDIWLGYNPGVCDIKRVNMAKETRQPFSEDVTPPVWDLLYFVVTEDARTYIPT